MGHRPAAHGDICRLYRGRLRGSCVRSRSATSGKRCAVGRTENGGSVPVAAVSVVIGMEVVVAAPDAAGIDAGKIGGIAGQAVALIRRRLGIDAERPRASGREVL